MFSVDKETMEIRMHRGDTGPVPVRAIRGSGLDWTAADRMIFTVRDSAGDVVLQRYYRLDDGRTSVELPNGTVLIELHNGDTDTWDAGQYQTELRFVMNAVWDGEPETDDMTDALLEGVSRIIDGVPVWTAIQSLMMLDDVYGEV